MPKVLNEAQIAQFWDQGYVVPVDCLSPDDALAVRRKFEDYERSDGTDARDRIRGKSHLVFSWMTDLVRHRRILDAVEDLIGPNILIYLSTSWFKDARDPSYVTWHQDSAYYGLDPHDVVTVWIGLTNSNRGNGCVRVIPRSHLGADQLHVETLSPNNLLSRGQSIEGIDESAAVDLELAAGQFSIHHERLVHGSLANMSDDRRLGMSFTYFPTYVRSVVGRRGAMLVRGVDSFGHWDAEPEPRFDLDPIALAAIQRWVDSYTDAAALRQEFERAGTMRAESDG